MRIKGRQLNLDILYMFNRFKILITDYTINKSRKI